MTPFIAEMSCADSGMVGRVSGAWVCFDLEPQWLGRG